MKTLSFAITAHNEHEELRRLLDKLPNPTDDIEIVMLFDENNVTREVTEVGSEYFKRDSSYYTWYLHPLNDDFASYKNHLNSLCEGDYIFQIDADEYPHQWLLDNIQELISSNESVDLFWVPRINTVDGLTDRHVNRWSWTVDSRGWVNFPDYQSRIYKNDKDIRWQGNVHERIVGQKTFAKLPPQKEFSLFHPKTVERQEVQNNYYDKLMVK